MTLTMLCRTCGFVVSARSEAALALAYCAHAEYAQSQPPNELHPIRAVARERA
jgi:hypothetical protein